MARNGRSLLAAKAKELGSQAAVAERAGVSQPLVSRIINTDVQPSLDTALDFRDTLGIPVDAWRRRPKKRVRGGPRRSPAPSPQSGGVDGQAA